MEKVGIKYFREVFILVFVALILMNAFPMANIEICGTFKWSNRTKRSL